MKKGKVFKTERYYFFWSVMTVAVIIGQIYVGLGYRLMAASLFEVLDKVDRAIKFE